MIATAGASSSFVCGEVAAAQNADSHSRKKAATDDPVFGGEFLGCATPTSRNTGADTWRPSLDLIRLQIGAEGQEI
jgi:hypothetical protein